MVGYSRSEDRNELYRAARARRRCVRRRGSHVTGRAGHTRARDPMKAGITGRREGGGGEGGRERGFVVESYSKL